MALPMDQMRRIIYDIVGEVDPKDSQLHYTVEMKQWRLKAEAELAELRKTNPKAEFVIPDDV